MGEQDQVLDVWLVGLNTVYQGVPVGLIRRWAEEGRLLREDRARLAGGKDEWAPIDALTAVVWPSSAPVPAPRGAGQPRSRVGRGRALALGATLAVMLLLLIGGWALFRGPLSRQGASAPGPAVRLAPPGDTTPNGAGLSAKTGEAPVRSGLGPLDTGLDPGDETVPGKVDVPPRPRLNPVERVAIRDQFDPGMARLDELTRSKLRDGLSGGAGAGGKGTGGGKGSGTDKAKSSGTGKAKGSGKGVSFVPTLTQREKRMLRWNLRFPASTSQEYLDQLDRLGAILAIPVAETPEMQYKVVRDLKARPAKLLDEDLTEIKRIYWIDDNPTSVDGVMRALGLAQRPSRIVAFMPERVENDLYAKEKRAYEARYGAYQEDRIYETRFRLNPGAGYTIEVVSLTLEWPGQ